MTNTGRKGRTHANVAREVRVSTTEDTSQLLEMAFGLHQAGELGRARGLYERIIEQDPGHADALHFLGMACFQQGDADRAAALIRRAIERKPQVAPYHDNLGAVLEFQGQLDEALLAYREAARLDGEDAERTFNMGVVLHRLGRLEEAEAAYRQAIVRAPDDGGFHYNLGNLLKGQGRLEEAVTHYRLAMERDAGSAEARNNLGNALQALGRLDEAVEAYRGAMEIRPGDAAVHLNLANVHRVRQDLDAAAAGYGQAVSLDPTLDHARRALAEVEQGRGRFEAAVSAYQGLLARMPRDPAALTGLAAALRYVPGEAARPALHEPMLHCFEAPEVQVQDLAAAAAVALRGRHRLDGDAGDMAACLERLAADPLTRHLLTRTINVDPRLEAFLTAARAHLLRTDEAGCGSPSILGLVAAMGIQCFINEYVFLVTPDEEALLGALRSRVERELREIPTPDDGFRARCALLALYQPLLAMDGGETLGRWDRDAWGEALWPLMEHGIREPLEERRLEPTLPAIGHIEDDTSVAVRAQYEEHPYPRWLELPRREPVGYGDYLAGRFPWFRPPSFLDHPVRVLAAGCGTGQEAVAIAAGRSGCRVLGLDLSRRSLAYASRMAGKLGVEGVEFVHGDILHAPGLGRRFHVIESTGVLHHMADPLAGWRALTDCLEPEGLMRVGLYSEQARRDVVAAREVIRARGLRPVDEDIRGLRAEILAGSGPLAELAESEDLYTMSACRDLLFHVQEHRFTIPAIAGALESLGLEFVGFDLPVPGAVQAYREFNPGDTERRDLSAWQRLEQSRPELFAALYVFWCRKRP